MGVRPPSGSSDEPDVVEFGIAALTPRLDDSAVEYPATGREIVESLDDPRIPVDPRGRTIRLSRAIEDVEQRRFDSERELLDALHPVFESYRENVSRGLLESLRGLFPY